MELKPATPLQFPFENEEQQGWIVMASAELYAAAVLDGRDPRDLAVLMASAIRLQAAALVMKHDPQRARTMFEDVMTMLQCEHCSPVLLASLFGHRVIGNGREDFLQGIAARYFDGARKCVDLVNAKNSSGEEGT